MKRIMLVTSDAWSMSHLSQQPREAAYYIVDCQISVLYYVSCELHPYEYINMVLCGRFSMCAYIYVDTFYLHSNGLMTHFKL